jgi:cupin superfamily acireductone dioxygenase involved in methionine salvage
MLYYGLNEEAVEMSCSETNYCKKDKMSICTAKDSKQQERCSFFEKSSHENRCMYFIFDEYCDCLNAQIQTK